MKRTVWLAAAAVMVAAVSYATATQGAGASDKDKLQGTWEFKSITFGGKTIDVPAGKDKMTITFKGDKFTFEDGTKKEEGTFKLDTSKKPPQIEIMKASETKPMKGIYQIDGDTFKIGFGGGPDAPPPASFDGDMVGVMSFKRAKK